MKKDCSFTFYHNAMRTLHNPCGTRKVFFAVLSPMLTTLCKLGLKVLKTFPYVLMSVVKDSCAKNYEGMYQTPPFSSEGRLSKDNSNIHYLRADSNIGSASKRRAHCTRREAQAREKSWKRCCQVYSGSLFSNHNTVPNTSQVDSLGL